MEYENIWDALMTGRALIDDLVTLEKAGIDTGFDKGAVEKWVKESEVAFQSLLKFNAVVNPNDLQQAIIDRKEAE